MNYVLKKALVSCLVSMALALPSAQAADADFDGANGVLTIPTVNIGGQVYRNAKLQLEPGNGILFRLIGIDDPTAGQCSESNINFTRYRQLPAFYTQITETELNDLIGCTATVVDSTASAMTLRWLLPSSTQSCPRYIEAELYLDSQSKWAINGRSIVGINSDTNQPYPCTVP